MNLRVLLSCLAFGAASLADLCAGTLARHVRDLNWFARRADYTAPGSFRNDERGASRTERTLEWLGTKGYAYFVAER